MKQKILKKQFYSPVKLIFSNDCFNHVVEYVEKFGSNCFIVSQDNNEALKKYLSQLKRVLNENNIRTQEYTNIRPNPLKKDVKRGIEKLKDFSPDVVIAMGGGSVIDTAKVLAFSNNHEIIWDNMFDGSVKKENSDSLPLIAIPTTAGTGSHVTQAAVISDDNNQKYTVFSDDFFPEIAIIDPSLTMSLPNKVTAATGFDAFCHLSESYINGNLNPMLEILALAGMRLIKESLPKVMIENKYEYREKLSLADTLAGICLSNGGANSVHAIGEIISSNVIRIDHGSSLAIVYPGFIRDNFNNDNYRSRIRDVLEIVSGNKKVESIETAVRYINHFLEEINLRQTLSTYNVTEKEYESIMLDITNQKRFKLDEIYNIRKSLENNRL